MRFLSVISSLIIAAGCLLGFGYVSFKGKVNWIYRAIDPYAISLRDNIFGAPDRSGPKTRYIDSIFLRFRVDRFPLEGAERISGGALAKWGNQVILLHATGKVFSFDGETIRPTNIETPDNGKSDYLGDAASEKYAKYEHRPKSIRYNDITFIDSEIFRGFAISYTFYDTARECYGTRVPTLAVPPQYNDPNEVQADPGDWRLLYESAPCLPLNPSWIALDGMMAGGRMAYNGAGKLILGNGDYNLNGIITYDVGIQDDAVDYGKVMEIDIQSGESRVISKGHRNLQGVAIDSAGRIWTTEHGERGGDELNLIRYGANYGWPLESLGTHYNGEPLPLVGPQGRHVLHTPPVYAWLPSVGVSCLNPVSDFDPTWDGDLLACSMSALERGNSLFRLRIDGERIMFAERIPLGTRIRYAIQSGRGQLVLWTDAGDLFLLTVVPRPDLLGAAVAAIAGDFPPDTVERAVQIADYCQRCHSFAQGVHESAPSLNGVFGRGIGTTGFGDYSDSLRTHGGYWTEQNLRRYIMDPAGFALGTAMPSTGVEAGGALDALIALLKSIDTNNEANLIK